MKKPKRKLARPNATGRNDTELYVNMPFSMLRSDAWRSLSGPAVKVWLELRHRYNGGNNGQIPLSLDEAKDLLHLGKATVVRALAELEQKGFAALVTRGQWYGRIASQYAITDKPLNGAPATRAWTQWRPRKSESRFSGGPIGVPDGSATEPSE